MLLSSTSTISTENGIIRAKGTSFCFPHHADRSNAGDGELCNAKHDSVAYCDTTRPEQHEYWLGLLFLPNEKCWSSPLLMSQRHHGINPDCFPGREQASQSCDEG